MPHRAAVITCSDAASRGERTDRSGPAVREILLVEGYAVGDVTVVPDDRERITDAIREAAASGARLIVTTGGTGISPRDVTPEATMTIADRIIPGFGELMRFESLRKTPMAPLSRAQAASLGPALIVNLPGSVSGAAENLRFILHLIPHALELLSGANVEDHPQGR